MTEDDGLIHIESSLCTVFRIDTSEAVSGCCPVRFALFFAKTFASSTGYQVRFAFLRAVPKATATATNSLLGPAELFRVLVLLAFTAARNANEISHFDPLLTDEYTPF